MRLRSIAATGLAAVTMAAGMTAVAAPQASAAGKCEGTKVAHKPIKKGKSVIGYLDVYNSGRMVCATVTAKSRTGTKGLGVFLKDGLSNDKDVRQGGKPMPTKKQWKAGWDAVDSKNSYRKYAGPVSDYDNGRVFVHAKIRKNGTWYYQGYSDTRCGYDTWSELKKRCV